MGSKIQQKTGIPSCILVLKWVYWQIREDVLKTAYVFSFNGCAIQWNYMCALIPEACRYNQPCMQTSHRCAASINHVTYRTTRFSSMCLQMSHFLSVLALQWRDNERDGVSNHQPHECLLKRVFGGRTKKISKLRVTGLCAGNSPVTGEFPAQRASNAENFSIWWRHHGQS